MRTEKEHLHAQVISLIKTLREIHAEIPPKSIKPLPFVPVLNIDAEFPEKKITVCIDIYVTKHNYNMQIQVATYIKIYLYFHVARKVHDKGGENATSENLASAGADICLPRRGVRSVAAGRGISRKHAYL